jgi:molybdopterin adenylyltransferase
MVPDEMVALPRVLVAAVMPVKSRSVEASAKAVEEEIRAARLTFVRSVVAKGEPQFIEQLVSNVSNDNEADAIVLVGGSGFGPNDKTCEAINSFVERRIEGFGEACRRLLMEEFESGTRALLARAAAGVFNKCVIFAVGGPSPYVRRVAQALIVPVLAEAVALATGKVRAHDPWPTARPS